MSLHNKPNMADTTELSSQDYTCTDKDMLLIEYINLSPLKKNLVEIGDAFITKTHLECLIENDKFLNGDVISAYIYCLSVQEHLRYRAGGRVYLENTFISTLIKRDGDVSISPRDHANIAKRVANYLKHDMVFIPVNIKELHWYLAVVNARKCEIHVLDSVTVGLSHDDLAATLRGLEYHLNIASQREDFNDDHEWQNLQITTWPIIEQIREPMQTDSTSCGLFMLKYMEFWTGEELSTSVTQEGMNNFRFKLAAMLVDSELNNIKFDTDSTDIKSTVDDEHIDCTIGTKQSSSAYYLVDTLPVPPVKASQRLMVSKHVSPSTIIPLTVKQIADAQQYNTGNRGTPFIVDTVEITTIKLVGMVKSKVESTRHLSFTLDDGTGRIDFIRWVNDTSDSAETSIIKNGIYVVIIGSLNGFESMKRATAFSIRPITDFNEFTLHFIQCIRTYIENTKPKTLVPHG